MLKIGNLLGDDIGLEVVPEAVKVMKAAAAKTGLEVQWSEHLILSGKMLFEWLGHKRGEAKAVEAARRIEAAVDKVIAEAKHLTRDLGGSASTTEMGDAIAAAV